MTASAANPILQPLLQSIADLRNGAGARPWNMAVVEGTIRLGEMSPLHVHDEDEAFHVIEGAIVVHAAEEVIRLEAGEMFVASKGLPHTVRGDAARSRYVVMASARSVSRYEDFLRAVARPVAADSSEWASPEDAEVVRVIAEANGIRILGAPGATP
jgi:quercetin dioxygenase-like cupin family protein